MEEDLERMYHGELMKSFMKEREINKCENTPEITELRKERDEYTRKAGECQKQIDKLIMECHKTPDVVGKIVKVVDFPFNTEVYGMVESVERKNDGVTLKFDFQYRKATYLTGSCDELFAGRSCGDVNVKWSDLSDIEVLTKEAFLEKLTLSIKDYTQFVNNATN